MQISAVFSECFAVAPKRTGNFYVELIFCRQVILLFWQLNVHKQKPVSGLCFWFLFCSLATCIIIICDQSADADVYTKEQKAVASILRIMASVFVAFSICFRVRCWAKLMQITVMLFFQENLHKFEHLKCLCPWVLNRFAVCVVCSYFCCNN